MFYAVTVCNYLDYTAEKIKKVWSQSDSYRIMKGYVNLVPGEFIANIEPWEMIEPELERMVDVYYIRKTDANI